MLFTRTGDLVQRLQAVRRDPRLPAELARLDRFDLLILDDFSDLPQLQCHGEARRIQIGKLPQDLALLLVAATT